MNHRMTKLAIVLPFYLPLALGALDPTLEKLREDLAARYIEAEPHMALARYYHDKGDRVQAFRLMESARRSLLSKEQFDEAFGRMFLKREPFDNSKGAEAALLKKHTQDSQSAQLAVKLADIYISREDWSKANYLNAYFLDPHFYDSEYAEQRIWTISHGLGQKRYEGLVKGQTRPEEILRDENPLVVGMAIDEMAKRWDGKYTKPVLEALGHDDEYVRAKALRALMANAGKSFDNDLKALLKDSDLRKRGKAGYLAVKLWGKEGITAVKPWLKEDAQLLRYDAASALFQYGGEDGRKIVREHVSHEKHSLLKQWLEAAIKEN